MPSSGSGQGQEEANTSLSPVRLGDPSARAPDSPDSFELAHKTPTSAPPTSSWQCSPALSPTVDLKPEKNPFCFLFFFTSKELRLCKFCSCFLVPIQNVALGESGLTKEAKDSGGVSELQFYAQIQSETFLTVLLGGKRKEKKKGQKRN